MIKNDKSHLAGEKLCMGYKHLVGNACLGLRESLTARQALCRDFGISASNTVIRDTGSYLRYEVFKPRWTTCTCLISLHLNCQLGSQRLAPSLLWGLMQEVLLKRHPNAALPASCISCPIFLSLNLMLSGPMEVCESEGLQTVWWALQWLSTQCRTPYMEW